MAVTRIHSKCLYGFNLREITIDPSSATLEVGQTITLVPVFDPSDILNQSVSWSTSDPAVAKVDSEGVVTGHAVGQATITALKPGTGVSGSCKVHVFTRVTGVTITPKTLELTLGQSASMTATVIPPDARVRDVVWTSHNDQIAMVSSDGLVTGVGMGRTRITVATVDGALSDSADVEVIIIPVEGVTITPTSLNLHVGSAGQLSATIIPADATDQSVTWATGILQLPLLMPTDWSLDWVLVRLPSLPPPMMEIQWLSPCSK